MSSRKTSRKRESNLKTRILNDVHTTESELLAASNLKEVKQALESMPPHEIIDMTLPNEVLKVEEAITISVSPHKITKREEYIRKVLEGPGQLSEKLEKINELLPKPMTASQQSWFTKAYEIVTSTTKSLSVAFDYLVPFLMQLLPLAGSVGLLFFVSWITNYSGLGVHPFFQNILNQSFASQIFRFQNTVQTTLRDKLETGTENLFKPALQISDSPKILEPPKIPETSKILETSKIPETPKILETPKISESPESFEIPFKNRQSINSSKYSVLNDRIRVNKSTKNYSPRKNSRHEIDIFRKRKL